MEWVRKFYPIFLFFGALFLVRTYVFSFALVVGSSMEPNFHDGDLVLMDKTFKNPGPGDVVVVEVGARQRQKLVKRLVAMGRSKIYIQDFVLYVNDTPFTESDTHKPVWDYDRYDCRNSGVYTTAEDEIFVLGDNRCISHDSRYIGPLKRNGMKGRILLRVIPSKWNLPYRLMGIRMRRMA